MIRRFRAVARRLGTSGAQSGLASGRGGRAIASDPLDRLEWSLSRGVGVPVGLLPGETELDAQGAPLSLYAALRAGGVIEHPGGDLSSVLEAVAEGHVSGFRRSRAELLGRLRSMGSRGFLFTHDGLAVPHPRRPVILPVAEPALALCVAEEPVPIGSTSVRVILSVVCPSVSVHLGLLGALSRLLAGGRFLSILERGALPNEIMDHVWLHDCGLADEELSVSWG